MARHLITLAAVGFLLTGCVAQDKYTALKIEKDQLIEQLGQAQSEASANKAAAEAWKSQLDSVLAKGGDSAALVNNLNQENSQLKAQLAILDEKYKHAMDERGTINLGSVNPQLANALAALAQQYPDMIEFSAASGLVKFKSDVTFARGSADLTPTAKQAIDRFAQILNSPAANSYEFLVAGHTDNTRVANPETIRAGHKDNWYLSSHRAITVGAEIIGQGVSSRRIGVLGYADQRPIASNATTEGQARNRRVEVLILPTTYRGAVASGEAAPAAPRPRATPRAADLNKDTVRIDAGPAFVK